MKEYISPTAEEFYVQAPHVVTASGDQIVSTEDRTGANQTIESQWKDTWQ